MSTTVYEVESIYREENGRFSKLVLADFLNMESQIPIDEAWFYWQISKYYAAHLVGMKDNLGNYIWHQGENVHKDSTILGMPVLWDEFGSNRICLVNDELNCMIFLTPGTEEYKEYVPWYRKLLFWK